jgi:hypothetical protein
MIKNLKEYLKLCPKNREIFKFDDYKEAYNFGARLRAIAMKEEGVSSESEIKGFDIEVSLDTVRISLVNAEELACR